MEAQTQSSLTQHQPHHPYSPELNCCILPKAHSYWAEETMSVDEFVFPSRCVNSRIMAFYRIVPVAAESNVC